MRLGSAQTSTIRAGRSVGGLGVVAEEGGYDGTEVSVAGLVVRTGDHLAVDDEAEVAALQGWLCQYGLILLG